MIHSLVPSLELSVHTLSAEQGIITLVLGLLWPRLQLSARTSRIAFWTFLYSSFATLIPFVWLRCGELATPQFRWGRAAHGSAFQETLIKVIIYSAAPRFFVSMALILWVFVLGSLSQNETRCVWRTGGIGSQVVEQALAAGH